MDSEAVETLDGLLQRVHVLSAYRDGPADRATIADRAGCSRSTVYRADADLDANGLIEDTPTGYRITGVGQTVVEQFERCHAVVEGAMHLRPLLDHADAPELIEHLHLLSDAAVIEQESSRPYHIEHRVRRIIDNTEGAIVGMTTGLGSPTLAEAMFDRVEAGVSLEWTLPRDTLEYFSTENAERAEAAFGGDGTAVFVREDIPLDLAIYDETLVVIGFDAGRGVIATVAITEDAEAVAWARDVIEACQTGAERVA